MTRLPLRRLAALLVAALPALAGAQGAGRPAAPAPRAAADGTVVQAPHYGDALFHFYQGKFFSSVTGLMASQRFERLAPHDDEAEVLRGGLLLSYGLHDEAGRIFAALIERGAKPAVRDRAWFYLAKIRWQRDRVADAEDALNRIGDALPAELHDEHALLRANVLLAREQPAQAAQILGTLVERKTSASRYARYNLGVALVRAGDDARGRALLDALGREPAENEEMRVLRDRANVALGFAALQDGRFDDARAALERVRLAGPQSNKALLGFGWAAASLKLPAKALVPWTELLGREGSDAAILEARIAVPYAYTELGAFGQALERYEDAIAAFDRETRALDESIAAIRAGKLVDGLLERNPGEEMGWFWNIRELPGMPHAGSLAPLLATHEFQEAFKNYRDLRFLERNLGHWREQLAVFDDMLANRRAGYANRLPQVVAKARDVDLGPLGQRRAALADELARAEAAADGLAFADERERGLLERIARVRATLAELGARAPAGAAERLRLAEGALRWNLAREQSARRWAVTKALRDLDAGLVEAKARLEAVARAQQDEPARHAAFAQRIAALRDRVQAQIPTVAALAKEQQGAVEQIAVAALEQQKERIAAYATQARFAVAQLYDRAQVSSAGGPDARP